MRSVTALVKLFEENGFTLHRRSRHLIWRCPCGHATVTTSSSIYGGDADKNTKQQLIRTKRVCDERMKEQ